MLLHPLPPEVFLQEEEEELPPCCPDGCRAHTLCPSATSCVQCPREGEQPAHTALLPQPDSEQLFAVTQLQPHVIGVTISASLPLLAAIPVCLPHTWTLPARRLGAGSAASPTPMQCPQEPALLLAEADSRPSVNLSSCWCQADSQAQPAPPAPCQPYSNRCRHTAQPTPVPITTRLHPCTKPTLLLPGLQAGGALPSSSSGFRVGTVLTGSISVPVPFMAARYDMLLKLRLSIPPPFSSVSSCSVTLGTDVRFCPKHAASGTDPVLGFRVGFLVLVETARLRGISCCVPTFSAAGLSVLSTMRRGSAMGKQLMAESGLRLPGGEAGAGGPDLSGWQRYSRRKVWSSAAGGLRDMAAAQGVESCTRDRESDGQTGKECFPPLRYPHTGMSQLTVLHREPGTARTAVPVVLTLTIAAPLGTPPCTPWASILMDPQPRGKAG